MILPHNAHRIRRLLSFLSLSQATQDIGLTFPRSRAESLFQTLLSSAAEKRLTHADLRLREDCVSLLSRAHLSTHTFWVHQGLDLSTSSEPSTSAAVLLYRGFRDSKRTYYAVLHFQLSLVCNDAV